MRALAIGLLLLAACDRNSNENLPAVEETPAAISFEGAGAKTQAARLAHGERLSWVLGCRGCHGAELQGQRFYELYASNLTRDLANYSDTQLKRLLREGVHPSGRDLWAMPSEIFQHLSEPDEAALIAHLRTLEPARPPTGKPLPFEAETKKLIAEGKVKPAAAFVRDTRSIGPADLGPQHALGRYITRVTCAECHGPQLKGGGTPDLVAAGAYSREEFERLLTQGVPTGGRKLKLMELVAKERFARLTIQERDALYAYLKARAEQPQ